ncbi:MAG: hypothetical protein SPH93_04810 [Clostridium sp.]|uniref:hypothetical protein n=1 Tax=Clostridium sp. TaxID=1506 RepID=UPI002A91D544|nr:hypothetical protein [Clostridium sp.]MDY6226983.1 hypothetical protein [Clostridium sp.]
MQKSAPREINKSRDELALRLKPIIQAKAKERQRESMANARTYNPNNSKEQNVQKSAPTVKNKSRDELAKIAGVSHDTIEKVECIKKKGTEEQIQRARSGGKGNSVNAIYKEIKNDTGSYRSLAEKYNISIGTIYKIKNNKY